MAIRRSLQIQPLLISWGRCAFFLAGFLAASALTHSAGADPNAVGQRDSQRLVAAAAQAEIAGDAPRQLALLNDAVRRDPENKTARWQLGQVQVDGKWVTAEEAQRRAAADPIQAEYRELRNAAGPSVGDQLVLARWCRKNKLNEEAELHWATVLLLDQTNNEALRALDLRWKDGQLVARNETEQQKLPTQTTKDVAKYWEPVIAKWRRAVAGRDLPAHDAALKEIQAVTRLDAIPFLEAVTLGRDAFDVDHAEECLQIAVAFVDALDKIPDQAATESLVRHAVLSPGNKARNSATEKLKQRPQSDYIPLLLSGLAMPVESSFSVTTTPDGSVHYTHSLYREGQYSDLSTDASYATLQHVLPGRDLVWRQKLQILEDRTARRVTDNGQRSQRKYVTKAAAIESQVQRENEAAEARSERIIPILAATTRKEFSTAKQWWDWWREDNEYYASEHPVERRYYSNTDHKYSGQPYDTYRTVPSCFVKGTPVWTKCGPRPIETLELGDLVLSQNVKSGELKYKPIIAKTTRPPSSIVKISLDAEELRTTKGHPFWVSGVGWRMAKELEDGAILHGVTGASRISIEPAPDAEAFNLVVADNSTYFVGERGVLVHDNTPRRSAQVVVPGVAAK